MISTNPCKKKNFVSLDHAIKHVLGINSDSRLPANLQARYRTLLSNTIRPREEGEWYFKEGNEKKSIRFESIDYHFETICCVHLDDFVKWVEYKDTESARLNIRMDLKRLEDHVIKGFRKRGFNGLVKKSGLFRAGSQYDINNFLVFAQRLESSDGATEEDIVISRIALALPGLWEDYRSKKPNPWILSSRMAVLCSAVPDPNAAKRLVKEKDDEIQANKEHVERGLKLLEAASEGGVNRAKLYEDEKDRFLEIARECMCKAEYVSKRYGWKTSLSLEVVGLMKKEVPYDKDKRYVDEVKRADSNRHWLSDL